MKEPESTLQVWIDFQDEMGVKPVRWFGPIPRIGEKVGSRILQAPDTFYLDYVIDVRHYPGEVRVMTVGRK